jgi:hypothetical protein
LPGVNSNLIYDPAGKNLGKEEEIKKGNKNWIKFEGKKV